MDFMVEIRLGFIINLKFICEICKNYFKIVGQIIILKKNGNDMAADVAQRERNNIKRYASAWN